MTLYPADRDETLSFLGQLRELSTKPNLSVVLDFNSLQKMDANACVLLVAELDRAQAHGASIQGKPASHPIIHQLLEQVGIYRKIGIVCEITPTDESVIHWRVATGVLLEGQAGGSLLDNYEGRLTDGLRKGLYAGIVEAMTNTLHHAYDGEVGKGLKRFIGRRWWMLSQERDDELAVCMCDLGIGIPRSLPRSKTFNWKDIRSVWKTLQLDGSDASAIKVALEMGRTRTLLKGRGKGLSDIIEAVNLSPEGRVLLGSNKGVFTCYKQQPKARNHSKSIRGTLIHWVVPIASSGE